MNKAMWRYYAVNQLLMGVSIKSLPAVAKKLVSNEGVAEAWEAALTVDAPECSEIERVFLQYLRVDNYGMCLTSNGRVLTLDHIVELVRENDMNVMDCSKWAAAALDSVVRTDAGEAIIKDGVLYLPKSYNTSTDLDGAMRKMFAYRCWGVLNPTTVQKSFVLRLLNFVSPEGDLNLTAGEFKDLVEGFSAVRMSPTFVSQTALKVSDLAPTLDCLGAVCWWSDESHQSVSAMLPRGDADRLVHTQLPIGEVLNICLSKDGGMDTLFVRGDRVVQESRVI